MNNFTVRFAYTNKNNSFLEHDPHALLLVIENAKYLAMYGVELLNVDDEESAAGGNVVKKVPLNLGVRIREPGETVVRDAVRHKIARKSGIGVNNTN